MKLFLLLILTGTLLVSCAGEKMKFKDKNVPLEVRVDDLLSRLTLEEKVSLTHGNTKFSVNAIERLDIPALCLSDGPHGVREEIHPHKWEPLGWTTDSASYFPTGTALAATWNPDLAYRFGEALGAEARARNKDIILGPGVNLMRTPLYGRNFEYLGEDPHLISQMVVPLIRGIQSRDVAACLKHYALNNQEFERFKVNVEVDERALHELCLPGFEAAVKAGEVLTVMGAYNKFRGKYSCNNDYLLNDILKKRWGFRGLVVSDWDATHSTVESALSGLDLEMGTTADDYDDF